MDWAAAFRVLSHEMRSPTAVISGYGRMLHEGRLDEAERAKAVEQIQRANALLGQISRQASDLALWIRHPPTASGASFTVASLIEHAIARVPPPATVTPGIGTSAKTRSVVCLDRGALSSAIAGLIEAGRREAGSLPVAVIAPDAGSDAGAGQSIVIGACSTDEAQRAIDASADQDPLSLERGGLGLALVVAVAVLEAHGARAWQTRGRPALLGITIPVNL
jgi:K+-sensing histidine kinase KdpD